jgi:hypothetical protein
MQRQAAQADAQGGNQEQSRLSAFAHLPPPANTRFDRPLSG